MRETKREEMGEGGGREREKERCLIWRVTSAFQWVPPTAEPNSFGNFKCLFI